MASSLPEAPASATRRFADGLRQRSDTALVALLRARGDLAVPSPATLRSLAARASSHTSLERALAHVDALVLQVIEAVTALGGLPREEVPHALGADAPASPAGANGTDTVPPGGGTPSVLARQQLHEAVDVAVTAALLWDDDGVLRPSPGLDEVFGHYPAGLGPMGRGPETDPDRSLAERIRATPPEQRAVLDALAWGPPAGRVPPAGTRQREAVDALVAHGLLARADAQHVLLTREVGLALRDGRTHRAPALRPEPTGRAVPVESVAAESASAALELVRRVSVLLSAWSDDPPRVLRSGGLGVRDLRRLAIRLECDEEAAAFVAEIAGEAGLIRDDGEVEPSFVPLDAVWSELDDAGRWAVLARAWVSSHRTPWQAGTRDETGALRSVLSPALERGWAPRLRAAVLRVLGARENALSPDDVVAVLTWEAPRNAPPERAVRGLLAEASWLGLTGAGAMSPPGRALLALAPAETTAATVPGRESPAGARGSRTAGPSRPAGGTDPLVTALRGVLPREVDEMLLQGDLTGVVPGRPSRELASLVELATDTESRGAATTVRFSAASVTRALDRGRSADDLLAALARHSPVPVPQPLEYLVRDTARRHGAVRVGAASSYLRAADEVTLAGLERDPALAHLGLVRLAPTVLVASVPPALLHETLRERGVVSALEGPDGRVLDVRHRRAGDPHGPRPPASRSARAIPHAVRGGSVATGPPVRSEPDLPALVAGLRLADDDGHAPGPGTPGSGDAANATPPRPPSGTDTPAGTQPHADGLALLREAVRDGLLVRVDVVGAAGKLERRTLRPLRLDGGRLRAVDPARDAELTVAVHRIARVSAADDDL